MATCPTCGEAIMNHHVDAMVKCGLFKRIEGSDDVVEATDLYIEATKE